MISGFSANRIPLLAAEREDERGVAKRPDLNELDVPEWAGLALDKVERRKQLLQRIAL